VPAPRRAAKPALGLTTHHPALDRLIHGRAWIGIVAFALIGIVTMQLGLLKLNAGIGRALEHEGALQRENAALSVENSEVAAGNTVELQAAHMGMRLVPAGSLRFLSASAAGSEIDRAVAALGARANGVGASAGSTSGEASSPSASAVSATPASSAPSESSSSTSASGEATSQGAAAPEASHTSTTGESESAPSHGAPSGAGAGGAGEAAAATTAPSGESGGSSPSPGG
jgi:hypothetical protein